MPILIYTGLRDICLNATPWHRSASLKSQRIKLQVIMKKSSKGIAVRNGRSTKHSRNGCGTCKIRRVKCDETKPSCNRCKTFGVSCEGYGVQPGKRTQTQRVRSETPPTANKGIQGQPQILPKPSNMLLQSEEDRQYIEFFRDQTASLLVPFCEHWCLLALQSSHNPIIHHAIIAMAALHKTSRPFESEVAVEANVSLVSVNERRAYHHQKAISHYGKVIKLMREEAESGNQDLRTTLIASLLVIGFETFHGNFDLANAQIQIALDLISQWTGSFSTGRPRTVVEISPAPGIVEHELIQCFGRLDIQSMTFFDREMTLKNDPRTWDDVDWTFPSEFKTLDEAEVYLDIGVIRRSIQCNIDAFNIMHRKSGTQLSSEEITDLYSNLRQTTLGWLEEWTLAYSRYLEKTEGHAESCCMRLKTLRLRYLWMSSCLKFGIPRVSSPDDMVSEMAEMLQISERLLDEIKGSVWDNTRYVLKLGVIVPLFMVAHRCPLREYRNRAIEILLSHEWREGLWDSKFAGRTAQWIQSLEEELADAYTMPSLARVQMSTPMLDFRNRSALVMWGRGTFAADGSAILDKKATTITW